MTDPFDPSEIAEIEARLERVEAEASTTLCLYVEMPYDAAAHLVKTYRGARTYVDLMGTIELFQFMVGILDSLEDTLQEAGLDPDA